MAKQINNSAAYIQALEEELNASLEREHILENEIDFGTFAKKKFKKTKLYTNVISNPDSKAGKVMRAPRTAIRIIKNPKLIKEITQKKTVNNPPKPFKSQHLLDPWNISVTARVKIARQALDSGQRLAIYFVEKPDSSTFRYRCFNTFEITKSSSKWQAVYFFKNEIETVQKLLPKASLLIFGRQLGQEKNIAKLTELAHTHDIKVGLDIDDLVFDTKYLDIMLDTIDEKINRSYWANYFISVQAMAKKVDFFITTNQFLSKKVTESFNKPCKEIRNSLNQAQVNASMVYAQREKARADGKFIMGYFSGSPTHKKDLGVALPEVLKFLQDHPAAVLRVAGYMRFDKSAEKFLKNQQIQFVPMVDFRKLQRLMAAVDVNIAPLLVNDFTNCKSELKFFEAGLVETTTIASPSFTFAHAITDGKNGFLAQPGEWYKKIEYLYKNPKENRRVALAAKNYALRHYSGQEFLQEVERTYDFFV